MSCSSCGSATIITSLVNPAHAAYFYVGYADDDIGTGFSTSAVGKCYISFMPSDIELTNTVGIYTAGWIKICPDPPSAGVETDVTVTTDASLIFTTSGTAQHDLNGQVQISATAGNLLTLEVDGLFVDSVVDCDATADCMEAALADFATYDPVGHKYYFDLAVISGTVTREYIEDLLATSFTNMTYNDGANSFTITSIDAELVQDALSTAFPFLTYVDASNNWTFTPGSNGQVWTTTAGVAGWAASPSANRWAYDGNTPGSVKWLGTTNAFAVPFRTNNIERARILSSGEVGIATTTPLSTFEVNGSHGRNLTNVSVDTLLTAAHDVVYVDATAANRIITLPTCASAAKRTYTIIKTDATANTVTITPNGAETINGAATLVIGTQYAFKTIQANTNWYIIN